MNQPKHSPKPIRYLVRHYHIDESNPTAHAEEVIVTYNGDLPDAFRYAVDTASRYRGVIYADYGEPDFQFIRSYVDRQREDVSVGRD